MVTLDVTLTSDSIADLDALTTGDVVVSTAGHGFLRRIVSIEKTDDSHYILTTEDISLEEVIELGSGYVFKEMTHGDLIEPLGMDRSPMAVASSVETIEGVQLLPGEGLDDRVFRFVIGRPPQDGRVPLESIGGELKWTDPATGVELTLSGSIDVTIDIETGVSFKWLKLHGFTFIPQINAEESLEINVAGELSTPKLEKKLATFNFSPIVFFIGPVPVVIVPQVDLIIGIDAKIGAQVYSRISFNQTARAGIVYNRGAGVNVVNEFILSHDFSSPTLTGYAAAMPYLTGSPSIMVYGLTGPEVYLKGYLKLTGKAEVPLFRDERCSTGFFFSAYGGMDAGFGWDLGLLESILGSWAEDVDLRISLYEKEWLLREWNVGGNCSQAEPPYLEVQGPDIIRTVQQGSGGAINQEYTFKNSGEMDMDWTIGFIEDAAISVTPRSGTLSGGQTATVTVTIDTGKLSRGNYSNTINFNNLYDPGVLSGYASGSTSRQVRMEVIRQPSGQSLTNSLGMTFNLIPAGTFMMGSPSNEPGRLTRETQHQVTLTKSYYMQTTEFSHAQWRAVMGSNLPCFSDCGDDCPVERVSWYDVQEFITELNNLGQGTYRLPTEAEWEYAARAGTTTPFNTGICLSTDQANYDGRYPLSGCPSWVYRAKTLPVASFAPNAWGLYDMHGNVWEWVQDWYGSYPAEAATDPTGPLTGSNRVMRGGNWMSKGENCRSAFRRIVNQDNQLDYYRGFRLVLPQVP
jgi:formylglycine-generating enzyme